MNQMDVEKINLNDLSLIFRKNIKNYSHQKKNFATQREKCIFGVGKNVSQQNISTNISLIIKKKTNTNNSLKK